jgi:iron complex transport system substrate-binding protein
MRVLILIIALFITTAQARTITDDYGRVVTIPDKITKIYAASPPLTMSLLAFDPALVAALNAPFKEEQKPYVGIAAFRPVAGGYFGQGETPNFETLAAIKPDVIIMWGKATGAENQLKKFAMLGIPVLMIHNESINDLVTQFQLYGKLTGNTKRARELVAYTQETLGLIQSLQAKLDKRKDVRYYLAEGLDGLSSECDGSFHLEPFTYSGAKNALKCKMSSNYGMEKMSLETILVADPDVIVAMEDSFAASVKSNPQWQSLRAVKSGHILTVPNTPFNYITRPPSFMRLMGIRWLIHSFYPDILKGSLDNETARFNKLFFQKFKLKE